MKIVENYIVPVIRFSRSERGHKIEAPCGTAFLINDQGAFVTATHVLQAAKQAATETGTEYGLMIRGESETKSPYWQVGRILASDCAKPPFDIVVGIVDKPTQSCFVLTDDSKLTVWDDVYTVGYPDTAAQREAGLWRIDTRALRGHVVRKLPAGHALVAPHPECMEVSFAIPASMSGSPLVLRYTGDVPPGAPFPLLGVRVANQRAELTEFAHETIEDDGKTFRERRVLVEQFGIVHSLKPLWDWAPPCLNGETLLKAIRPSRPGSGID